MKFVTIWVPAVTAPPGNKADPLNTIAEVKLIVTSILTFSDWSSNPDGTSNVEDNVHVVPFERTQPAVVNVKLYVPALSDALSTLLEVVPNTVAIRTVLGDPPVIVKEPFVFTTN